MPLLSMACDALSIRDARMEEAGAAGMEALVENGGAAGARSPAGGARSLGGTRSNPDDGGTSGVSGGEEGGPTSGGRLGTGGAAPGGGGTSGVHDGEAGTSDGVSGDGGRSGGGASAFGGAAGESDGVAGQTAGRSGVANEGEDSSGGDAGNPSNGAGGSAGEGGTAGNEVAGVGGGGGLAAGGFAQTAGGGGLGEAGGFAGAADPCTSIVGVSRTCTTSCPCGPGEGVCTTNAECATSPVCADEGRKYGVDGLTCLPAHCDNDVLDGGEVSVDCGGECGCQGSIAFVPVPEGATLLSVHAVSGSGLVVVGGYRDADGIGRAFRWIAGNPLGTLPLSDVTAFVAASADAVNYDGGVIVGAQSCAGGNCGTLATRWDSGIPTVIEESTFNYSKWTSVSADGRILVGQQNPFIQLPIVEVGGDAFQVGESGWINAISGDGTAAGGTLRVDGHVTATIWDTATWEPQPLTEPGETYPTSVMDLSSDGLFAVCSDGYRWSSSTGLSLLAVVGNGYVALSGEAITASGELIVGSVNSESAGEQAAVWDVMNRGRLLAELLAERGVELPPHMTLRRAVDVSDDGRVIIGYADGESGPISWRVTLP